VSAAGSTQRITVFAAFVVLAAVGAAPLFRGAPAGEIQPSDLAALEKTLFARARMHPAVKPPEPAGSAAFCAGCHPPPSHAGRGVADAMANEHAARMDCLVCHWSAAAGARPAPAWLVLSGAGFLAALPPERSSPEQLAALRSAVTAARRCFERGTECAACHRPGGMGSLQPPGTPSARTAALEQLENYFTLGPGEKWYFPQLK
jgi:hypothetical protein